MPPDRRRRSGGPGRRASPRREKILTVRRSGDRGYADHGWLRSRHTFSFANYFDPAHMGFRALRVINEDRVAPRAGFGPHGHRDMEIVSYVLSGAMGHRDSTGSAGVLRPGEVQRMTAGTGVMHSEMNASDEELHFLQIWLLPEKANLPPGYEQKAFPEAERRGALRLLVSPNGEEGSLRIHQDVKLFGTLLSPGERVTHVLAAGRHAWLQVARGTVELNRVELRAGDGAAVSEEERLVIEAKVPAEALLFNLA